MECQSFDRRQASLDRANGICESRAGCYVMVIVEPKHIGSVAQQGPVNTVAQISFRNSDWHHETRLKV